MFREHTSGTTGTPLSLWCTRRTLRSWYALAEARWRRWYGVSLNDRWGLIGGQRVVPFRQATPPFWVWNAGLKQLYMSSFHTRPDFLRHYLNAIERYSLVHLYGYSSALYWLALEALESGRPLNLKVTVTNAEPLHDHQREAISAAFSCPVRETYGQAEFVSALSECEDNNLHSWPEVGYAEFLDEHDQAIPTGGLGRLIATSFINEAMPLIRYEVMDMVQASDHHDHCSCGRTLPLVKRIIGRLADTIVTRDGRRLALTEVMFRPQLRVREAQIVQNDLDSITVKIVPAKGWCAKDEQEIRSRLHDRIGDMRVVIEAVPEIERTCAGKFPIVISHLRRGRRTPPGGLANRP
jgi:phenylacetate-CoA ligase